MSTTNAFTGVALFEFVLLLFLLFRKQIPQSEARAQEQRLLASYLTCTGIVPTPRAAPSSPAGPGQDAGATTDNDSSGLGLGASCLERLSCELHHNDTSATGASPLERHVMRV